MPLKRSEPVTEAVLLQDVALGYAGRDVLTDVNLRVRPAELWCLLGENGAGKSTLLLAMAGVIKPLQGRIERSPDIRLGFVPQRADTNEELPLLSEEFVDMGLANLHLPRGGRRKRVQEALELAGARAFSRRQLTSLSGGQRQRVLIARALVRKPQLLLADEPEAGLDESSRQGILRLLLKLNREQGVAVVLTTHDRAFAAELATHVLHVANGSVEASTS